MAGLRQPSRVSATITNVSKCSSDGPVAVVVVLIGFGSGAVDMAVQMEGSGAQLLMAFVAERSVLAQTTAAQGMVSGLQGERELMGGRGHGRRPAG